MEEYNFYKKTTDCYVWNSVDGDSWNSVDGDSWNSVDGDSWNSVDGDSWNSVDGDSWNSVDGDSWNSVDGDNWNDNIPDEHTNNRINNWHYYDEHVDICYDSSGAIIVRDRNSEIPYTKSETIRWKWLQDNVVNKDPNCTTPPKNIPLKFHRCMNCDGLANPTFRFCMICIYKQHSRANICKGRALKAIRDAHVIEKEDNNGRECETIRDAARCLKHHGELWNIVAARICSILTSRILDRIEMIYGGFFDSHFQAMAKLTRCLFDDSSLQVNMHQENELIIQNSRYGTCVILFAEEYPSKEDPHDTFISYILYELRRLMAKRNKYIKKGGVLKKML
jgi:hypothetical protein